MDNELAVIGSELPVLQTKGAYKYLKEITGNGSYYQVAWQKLADGYVALYGIRKNNMALQAGIFPRVLKSS